MDVLGRVWDLSDIDGDGLLDRDEFTVVCICVPLLFHSAIEGLRERTEYVPQL